VTVGFCIMALGKL